MDEECGVQRNHLNFIDQNADNVIAVTLSDKIRLWNPSEADYLMLNLDQHVGNARSIS